MIAHIEGVVDSVGLHSAVIDVGGMGMMVLATHSTLAQLRVGERARLHASLVVREDSMTLYGFGSSAEREAFHTVQTVSGVGPKLALIMLSVLSPQELAAAIEDADATALQRVPGIGKKSAQRIVLELAGKLQVDDTVGRAPAGGGQARADVVTALVGLGWNEKVASGAVDDAIIDLDAGADDAAVLRAALQTLGRS